MAGIYIHIPFCKSKCRYCDFTSYPSKIGFAEAYMACVYKEIKLRAPELKNKYFDTVYFGGGTPSIIGAEWIAGCLKQIRSCLNLNSKAEITIEINPGTVDAQKVATYKKAGINRFSIGLQSANDSLLEEIGRIHTALDFTKTCKLIGNLNKSADLMIGLKGQTNEDIRKSIIFAKNCGVSHISLYALTPEDGTPIYSDYLNGELPDSDEVAAMYDEARKYLAELGFIRYEVSNFCRTGFESRHNLNYWKRGEYIGFGVAACSFMQGRRFANTRDLDEYIKCILTDYYPIVDNEEIKGEDAKFEKVMLSLRTAVGLNLAEYEQEFGSEFLRDFAVPLQKNSDYFEITQNYIKIKDNYLYVQNHILVDFLR